MPSITLRQSLTQIRYKSLHSLSLDSYMYHVGDKVELTVDSDSIALPETGTVVDIRGSGWYSVEIDGAPQGTLVKRRRSQLRPVLTEPSLYANAPESELETATNGETFIPLPKITDLDAELRLMDVSSDLSRLKQAAHHAKYDKFVVFSDLHCSSSSLSTCLEVLAAVHAQAAERGAGVIFLGDFWHHRSTLRVDCLNAVLRALSCWSVPLIMIPGNHDQVTLGGAEHGLTPLQNAYYMGGGDSSEEPALPGPMIFTHATKFRGAFFVPFVRDARIMERVVQSETSMASEAILCHVDVFGASMNDQIFSHGGVSPSIFPPHKHIYSGHFHKPHTVSSPKAAPDVAIQYVGSPYQTSLSEAGQVKSLRVVDASCGWQTVEKIPLAIGRRHHRVTSVDSVLKLTGIHKKDRVVVSMTTQDLVAAKEKSAEGESSPFRQKLKALRALGATVEVREQRQPFSEHVEKNMTKIAELEDLSPENTLESFLAEGKDRGLMSPDSAKELLDAGMNIVEEVLATTSVASAMNRIGMGAGGPIDLKFSNVTVSGFGPFKKSLTWPLLDRGLVLLRGNHMDDGSDSNGSGKTTLAMAILYCLTGGLDSRPSMHDAKSIINAMSKTAVVEVRGYINDSPFQVSRTRSASKGCLAFTLGGEDLTCQSIKDTQHAIESKLGISTQILARTMFHGQHSMNGLLEATDAKLKDELSLLVPIHLWQEAAALARKRQRSASTRASELAGMLSLRESDVKDLSERVEAARQSAESYQKLLVARQEQVEKQLHSLQSGLTNATADEGLMDACKGDVERWGGRVREMEALLKEKRAGMDSGMKEARAVVEARREDIADLNRGIQEQMREADRAHLALEGGRRQLRELRATWGLGDDPDDDGSLPDLPAHCPTCGQDLPSEEEGSPDPAGLRATLEADLAAALALVEEGEARHRSAAAGLASRARSLEILEGEARAGTASLEEREGRWEEEVAKLEGRLGEARGARDRASAALWASEAAQREAAAARAAGAEVEAELGRLRRDAGTARAAHLVALAELDSLSGAVRDLQADRDREEAAASMGGRLAELFGPRGVQSYILQSAVQSLTVLAQAHLDELSDGTLRLDLALGSGDRISRTALVRCPDGTYTERPLGSLSGGQWRRCHLALALGFASLARRRGGLRPSLLVLDEPLTHLDRTGRAQVGRTLRRLVCGDDGDGDGDGGTSLGGASSSSPGGTLVMILQDLSAEELEESFDSIDEVVREGGLSRLSVDCGGG